MSDTKCPDCDGPMVLRTNRMDGTEFYGCSSYPKCTGTSPVAKDRMDDLDDMPSDRARRNDSRRWRDE